MKDSFILAIDQGTSGTKTLLVDAEGKVCAKATERLKTHYLPGGWVEQDPMEILENVRVSVRKCLEVFENLHGYFPAIQSCGISNQRETFVIWDKEGNPLYNAVVWQCKRSVEVCSRLKNQGLENTIKLKTGLIIDPYFSGTKLIWLYENMDAVKQAIDAGEAYFGTVDTWLLYSLTHGEKFATDYTNASRTLFFNLSSLSWDRELIKEFGLSQLHFPECHPSSHLFGESDFWGIFTKPIRISAMIGDSHAAAFGEGCFVPGTAKATMGTGSSILMNTGEEIHYSNNGMVTTICWSTSGKVHYALEGVIVTCGATIEWLKNELGFISDSSETESIALSVTDNNGVYLIPAFSGLGAPYWDMNRKASISGMTFSTNKNHIVRAALESIPYQIKDVIEAMESDTGLSLEQLMIDGGISSNGFIVAFLADLLEKPVVSVGISEVSGLGAAFLAGLQEGVFRDFYHLEQLTTAKRTQLPSGDKRVLAWHQQWKKYLTL